MVFLISENRIEAEITALSSGWFSRSRCKRFRAGGDSPQRRMTLRLSPLRPAKSARRKTGDSRKSETEIEVARRTFQNTAIAESLREIARHSRPMTAGDTVGGTCSCGRKSCGPKRSARVGVGTIWR